jgi:thiol-disulfide isomerase/thioredoxin
LIRHAIPLVLLLLLGAGEIPRPALTKIDALNQRLSNGGDTTFVVNFWATWCGPCVAELPVFTKFDSISRSQKVKVILVSLDFKKDIDTKLVPFLQKKNIRSEVLFLDETNDNEWIPKVDTLWQGNIPATLISNTKNNYRVFIPNEMYYGELDKQVKASQITR